MSASAPRARKRLRVKQGDRLPGATAESFGSPLGRRTERAHDTRLRSPYTPPLPGPRRFARAGWPAPERQKRSERKRHHPRVVAWVDSSWVDRIASARRPGRRLGGRGVWSQRRGIKALVRRPFRRGGITRRCRRHHRRRLTRSIPPPRRQSSHPCCRGPVGGSRQPPRDCL